MEELVKYIVKYINDYEQKNIPPEYLDYQIHEEVQYKLDSLEFLRGFIKRLVDNDKIDKKKIDTRLVRYVESHYDEEGYWMENSYEDYSYTNTLLMILAISDTPIDDLINYLR